MGDYDDNDDWGNPYHDPPRDRNNPYARRDREDQLKRKLQEAEQKRRLQENQRLMDAKRRASSVGSAASAPKSIVTDDSLFAENEASSKDPSEPVAVEKVGTSVQTAEKVYVVAAPPTRPAAPRQVMDKSYDGLLDQGIELKAAKHYRVTRTVMETIEEITEDEWHLKRELPDTTRQPF